ncbi:hypothetical protein BCF33_0862 [Hasllibacter halocynthiae]|uniref:YIP1 family protein n=2 Tax=Hasllibacter halocynthiae TaxID=595589 RepID=A0A2T0X8K8_9RHOB|nr:hypothetical protein BCF33_0862 [Hasllibacter halocynthiae]
MALLPDIARTWRRPGAVQAEKIATGREDLALMYLMLACGLIFVGQWPALQRRALMADVELQPLLGASLMAWIFVAPVLFYAIALGVRVAARLLRRDIGGFAARMTLFWALMAAMPAWLLFGLTQGMIGRGPSLTAVGAVAFGAFVLFWLSGLRAAFSAARPSTVVR